MNALAGLAAFITCLSLTFSCLGLISVKGHGGAACSIHRDPNTGRH